VSANNQLVLVRNPDHTVEVWYDSCVDNPFPMSAHLVSKHEDFDAAMRSEAVTSDDTEYGIRVMDGPVHELTSEEADALWADAEEGARILLENAIANGACRHCSSTYGQTYHGAGNECDRDPNNPKRVVQEAMRQQAEFDAINIGYVARFVIEVLSEHFTLTKKT
jgi:hypothetical protein